MSDSRTHILHHLCTFRYQSFFVVVDEEIPSSLAPLYLGLRITANAGDGELEPLPHGLHSLVRTKSYGPTRSVCSDHFFLEFSSHQISQAESIGERYNEKQSRECGDLFFQGNPKCLFFCTLFLTTVLGVLGRSLKSVYFYFVIQVGQAI